MAPLSSAERTATGDRTDRVDLSQVRAILWARYRLWVRAASGSVWQAILTGIGLFAGLAFVLVATVGAGFLMSAALAMDRVLADGALHGFALFAFTTLVTGPAMGLRSNDFLDVTKLFLLPVNHRTVFAASIAGLSLSPWVFLFVLPLAVAAGTHAAIVHGGVLSVLAAVLAVLLLTATAIALGQGLLLLWLDLFRSRRWRDVSMIVMAVVTATFVTVARTWSAGGDDNGGAALEAFRRTAGTLTSLYFLPSFWAAHVTTGAGALRFLPVLALPPLLYLVIRGAARVQERVLHGDIEVGGNTASGVRTGPVARFMSAFSGRLGALLEKDFSVLAREPGVRVQIVQQLAYACAPMAFLLWSKLSRDASDAAAVLPFAGAFALFAVFFGFSALLHNPLGSEGSGIAHTLQTPVPRHHILLSKGIANALLTGLLTGLLAVLATIVTGVFADAPAARIAGFSALGFFESFAVASVVAGIGCIGGTFSPHALVVRDRRALAQAHQQKGGCLRALIGFGTFLLSLACALPIVVCFRFPWILDAIEHHGRAAPLPPLTGWLLLSVPVACLAGAGALLLGSRIGGSLLARREEEIVEALARPV